MVAERRISKFVYSSKTGTIKEIKPKDESQTVVSLSSSDDSDEDDDEEVMRYIRIVT